jgi:hypothetical protein
MSSRNVLGVRVWRWSAFFIVGAFILAATSGCSKQQSVAARIQKAYDVAGMKRTSSFKLEGTVTIDGALPERKKPLDRLIVMLYDPQKPDVPMERRPFCLVREDGHFKFSEDGIAPGHYVLAFALLRRKGAGNFRGPDQLNNLYNDPDVNAKTYPEFVIDHQAPGKTDYQFDLRVAGKDAVESPGPLAVTKASH